MRTVAALLERAHEPVDVVDLDLSSPRAGEVMVEIAATGYATRTCRSPTGH
jgi:Zn-dependent alcohol dehydrogenase